jgi:hypothetical protein
MNFFKLSNNALLTLPDNEKDEQCKIYTCNFNKNYSKLVLGGKDRKVTV